MNERSIFDAALDIADPTQRAAYLDNACSQNPQLRRHIDELLAAEGKLGSFLSRPPVLSDATAGYAAITEKTGSVIGPYKLMEQIGEGGMGLVFVAEQQEPVRRKVALKVIKPGMDTREVIARFEAERQALALMEHPNIARVFDAGATESGRPYFVMELVKGFPITDYCDQNQLTLGERLALFIDVCHAVQHAHTKGIIHRDLKPSNILITPHDGRPVVKVIDFGVAKAVGQALTDKTIYTRLTQMIGTPLYMSPEQAEVNALDVDTRGDVYALGVLLYELLTGTTPFDRERFSAAAFDEIRRIIREEEPPKPSTRLSTLGDEMAAVSAKRKTEPARLSASVSGDLDWIVMKCLEKDRTRRYETATGLARDVERYLKDEPVEACPPTVGYRLRKFARKNKGLLVTATAFATVLILGAAGSTWQAIRATHAEAVAEDNARNANDRRDEARELNKQMRRALYESDINRAHFVWEANGAELVRELLERHRPKADETDLRGFEWHYLNRISHADLLTLHHAGNVNCVVYSPDGKWLVTGGTEPAEGKEAGAGIVQVWDAETGKELFTLRGHKLPVTSLAMSSDGKRLASAAEDGGGVKVWDVDARKELVTIRSTASGGVALSSDGKRLAAGGGNFPDKPAINGVAVWDADTGKLLHAFKSHYHLKGVAFSPDGKRLAVACLTPPGVTEGGLKVWDLESGEECFSAESDATSVAYSSDGKRLAAVAVAFSESGKSPQSIVKVWTTETGKELLSIKAGLFHEHLDLVSDVRSVAFSTDGKRLAGAFLDHTVKVWDAETGDEIFSLKGHGAAVHGVAFSPDGTRLASASKDKTVKVWDAQSSQNPLTFKAGESVVDDVAVSPDGKCLAISSIRPGPDNGAFGEDVVKVLDAQTGKELISLKGLPTGVTSLVFSPNGKLLATATLDTSEFLPVVKLWDAKTGDELLTASRGIGRNCGSLAFSPDGKRLATAHVFSTKNGNEGELRVLDAQTGKELLTIKGQSGIVGFLRPPYRVYFSPNDKRVAATSGTEVKVWDAQTGKEVLCLKVGGRRLAFSPDAKRLATTGEKDVKVWDAQSGEKLLTLKGHTDPVVDVTFSSNGKRLASTSSDKTVKVWDSETGQDLLTLKGSGFSIAFSQDGNRLISVGPDGKVTIWDATPLPAKR